MAELCLRVEASLNNTETKKYYTGATSIVLLTQLSWKQSKFIKNSHIKITTL